VRWKKDPRGSFLTIPVLQAPPLRSCMEVWGQATRSQCQWCCCQAGWGPSHRSRLVQHSCVPLPCRPPPTQTWSPMWPPSGLRAQLPPFPSPKWCTPSTLGCCRPRPCPAPPSPWTSRWTELPMPSWTSQPPPPRSGLDGLARSSPSAPVQTQVHSSSRCPHHHPVPSQHDRVGLKLACSDKVYPSPVSPVWC